MKNIDVGWTVQIIANLGVIAGIVFLVFELQQNNAQLAAQSRFNYYQNRIAEYRFIAENGEVIELVMRSGSGEPLSAVDSNRVVQRMMGLITGWEYEFGEYEQGRISEEEFNVAGKKQVYQSVRALGPVWESYRSTAPRSFADFVDRNIATP